MHMNGIFYAFACRRHALRTFFVIKNSKVDVLEIYEAYKFI